MNLRFLLSHRWCLFIVEKEQINEVACYKKVWLTKMKAVGIGTNQKPKEVVEDDSGSAMPF